MTQQIFAKKYKLRKKIGSGAFGQVYQAFNFNNKQQRVAIKLQRLGIKVPQLFIEAKIMANITKQSEESEIDMGIPVVKYCAQQKSYNVLVMDLYGLSLQDLFTLCNQKFSLKTTLMLGIQMLQRIQIVHKKGYIHRDLKPGNFVMGRDQTDKKLHLIDFGLAKHYTIDNGMHITYKDNKPLAGTARYVSVNTHLGIEQSRRDDIQSIIYVLIYFVKGSLPWQNIKARNKFQKYDRIMTIKLQTSLWELCEGLPSQFQQFIKYSRCMQFQQEPDYPYLRGLLEVAMENQKYQMDYQYCWDKNQTMSKLQMHS